MPTLTGRHVVLQPLAFSHLDGLLEAALEDRSQYRWTFVPHDRATAQAFIEIALAEQERGASIPFATVSATDGRVLGSSRFMNIERWALAFQPRKTIHDPIDALEIGSTWLRGSAQRTAANSEAKLLMITHAFETLKVSRLTLKTDARNERSRAAIARLGCRLDGVLRAWQRGSDDKPRDTAIFSMLPDEWPEAKRKLEARLTRSA